MNWTPREASTHDVDFLVAGDHAADREDARGEPTYFDACGEPEVVAHRAHIARFITEPNRWTSIIEQRDESVAMILGRLRQMNAADPDRILTLEPLLPEGAHFGEIFQLFVHSKARRMGMATALKREIERVAREAGAVLLYTHTRARNMHVLALNQALGYTEIHRGPLWDEVVRVCLVKWL